MWERQFIGKEKSGISLNTVSPTAQSSSNSLFFNLSNSDELKKVQTNGSFEKKVKFKLTDFVN